MTTPKNEFTHPVTPQEEKNLNSTNFSQKEDSASQFIPAQNRFRIVLNDDSPSQGTPLRDETTSSTLKEQLSKNASNDSDGTPSTHNAIHTKSLVNNREESHSKNHAKETFKGSYLDTSTVEATEKSVQKSPETVEKIYPNNVKSPDLASASTENSLKSHTHNTISSSKSDMSLDKASSPLREISEKRLSEKKEGLSTNQESINPIIQNPSLNKSTTAPQYKASYQNNQSHEGNASPSDRQGIKSQSTEESNDYLTQITYGNEQFAHIKQRLPGLGRSITLDEGDLPKGSRLNILTITIMISAFLMWAALTPIKEIAVAQGEIIPLSFVKTIQHLEGGIIKEILVEDGSHVKEGQTLLRMDEKAATSELEQINAREIGLRIRAERLRAFGMNQTPDFDQFDDAFQNLINDQKSIWDMQRKNREDQISVIQKQIDQRKATLAVQEGRIKDLEHRVEVLQKQRDVLKDLYDKRLKTGTEYRGAEDTLAEVLVELNQAKNSALETQETINESESRILELNTRLRNESLIEMGNVTAEIAQVTELKLKLQDRVKRLDVKSPSSGIVKGLRNTTLQGVIQPGAEILQIVPKDNLEVEAKVHPKDVGKLHTGQNVLIKVSAFDYARYGGIDGKVKSVSATTFTDDKNTPFYRVFIKLSKPYVGKNPKEHVVTPGMTVQADIETDEKTLLQYLIKPIYLAFKESFREK